MRQLTLFLAFDTRNYGHTVRCVSTGQNAHLIDTDILRKKWLLFSKQPSGKL